MSGIPPYYDWIAHHAYRRPRQLAINDLQTARKLTYAELDKRIDRLTGALAKLGIGQGDRVALLAPNCAEYFELQFACGRLGAIMLPLNWRLTVPELEYILGDSTPKLLVHDKCLRRAGEGTVEEACSRSTLNAPTAPTSARWQSAPQAAARRWR